MSTTLIEQLYSLNKCNAIKKLYTEDFSVRTAITKAITTKIVNSQETIICSNIIDVLFLICLNAPFASSEDECNRVAITVSQYYNKPTQILPSIVVDKGLVLANKTLISLSFYPQALKKKWNTHGAPSPDFYRSISKAIFIKNGQKDIAEHHVLWEGFLGELLI